MKIVVLKIVGLFVSLIAIAVITAVTWQKMGVGMGLAVGVISLGVLQICAFTILGNVGEVREGIGLESEVIYDEGSVEPNNILTRDGRLNIESTEYYVTYLDEE